MFSLSFWVLSQFGLSRANPTDRDLRPVKLLGSASELHWPSISVSQICSGQSKLQCLTGGDAMFVPELCAILARSRAAGFQGTIPEAVTDTVRVCLSYCQKHLLEQKLDHFQGHPIPNRLLPQDMINDLLLLLQGQHLWSAATMSPKPPAWTSLYRVE